MITKDVVLVSGCRTAIGKFLGEFKNTSARELAIAVAEEAIKRAKIDPKQIDEIVMGEVFTGMQGSLPARQVGMRVGMSIESGAVSVNQNCASGMRALEIAANDIALGKTDIALVVGAENMTQAPGLIPSGRQGYRMGSIPKGGAVEIYDSMLHDGLYDELSGGHMGATADNVAKKYGITREECDKIAVRSHQLAAKATEEGKFKDEMIPIIQHTKKGDKILDKDEHFIPGCDFETISKLKPVFNKDGVTTAANASGINDGATAAILMSADKAKELGIKPMAKLLYVTTVGVAPELMGIGPAYAIPKCLEGAGIKFEDIDYFELNEAFAAQFLGCKKILKDEFNMDLDLDHCNLNGSGIALGHPVGSTGLRLVVSMIYEMNRHEGWHIGCASTCVGGGPAMASIWDTNVD
jgi:acetyl-CoA C-acetyltransferase